MHGPALSDRIAESHENEQCQTEIFRTARNSVGEVLERYRLLVWEYTGIKAVRLSARVISEIKADPTVPNDRRLWTLTVGTLLARIDREVDQSASSILAMADVRDRKAGLPFDWKRIATLCGTSVERAQQIHERAVWHFVTQIEPFGEIPRDWREAA